jgi:hypothetical protein
VRIPLHVEALEPREVPAAAFQSLPVLPFSDAGVLDHSRAIYARGHELGRRVDVFLKAGDSNTYPANLLPNSYLTPLGAPDYNPVATYLAAAYPALLDTLSAYRAGGGVNSFARVSTAAFPGWESAQVLGQLPGEVAATNAGIALVMVGTNDILLGLDPTSFRDTLTRIVSTLTSQGVLPIISTIPDILYASGSLRDDVNVANQIIADVAGQCRVPLWNFWRAETGLPSEGLDSGGVHLNVSPNGGGIFYPADLLFAQNRRNLDALQILDWFRETVAGGPTFIAPQPHWHAMAVSRDLYAVARDVGFSPTVDVYDADTGKRVNRFLAFEASFGGGVRVATGDVNGDGFTDVVCVTAAGTFARVRVFSGADGSRLANRVPFGAGYTRGLSVAVGDLDGDGESEVVVGKSEGSSGVRIYHGGDFTLLAAFRGFPGMAGGATVAVANVAGLGSVVAVASATRPVVRLFDTSGLLLTSMRVLSGGGYGVTVAAADLTGDGFDELAVARATGGRRVRVFDPGTQASLATFTVGPVVDTAFGIRLGALRRATGTDILLVGNGPGSTVSVRGFDDLTGIAIKLAPTNAARAYGIFVG